MSNSNHYTGLIKRYQAFLPVSDTTRFISLGEGNTPLIKLNHVPDIAGVEADIYVKYEGLNPTGSFKDRGMTMAVTKAVEEGSQAIICASTGNTSAAAAAYAARAGIQAYVLIPEGKIAMGKLAQAMMHGAYIIQIQGNFDEGMRLVKALSKKSPVTLVNSVNPYRLQGQKTAAYEIIEELGDAPDYHCLPVGNAGNITAHWIGYTEFSQHQGNPLTEACAFCHGDCQYQQTTKATKRPTMVGYQASGSAPFVRGAMVDDPETIATAIRIGHPQSWDYAHKLEQESQGWFDECSDAEILGVQKMLAEKEGVFCEPASAASLAGALRDLKNGKMQAGSTVVCTLTGHGLKDPDIAIKQSTVEVATVKATYEDVESVILSHL